jgi:hypothetical protein
VDNQSRSVVAELFCQHRFYEGEPVAESRPTERANNEFAKAAVKAYHAHTITSSKEQVVAINQLSGSTMHMAKGLDELATGLRATYILLEDVRNQLRQQQSKKG